MPDDGLALLALPQLNADMIYSLTDSYVGFDIDRRKREAYTQRHGTQTLRHRKDQMVQFP